MTEALIPRIWAHAANAAPKISRPEPMSVIRPRSTCSSSRRTIWPGSCDKGERRSTRQTRQGTSFRCTGSTRPLPASSSSRFICSSTCFLQADRRRPNENGPAPWWGAGPFQPSVRSALLSLLGSHRSQRIGDNIYRAYELRRDVHDSGARPHDHAFKSAILTGPEHSTPHATERNSSLARVRRTRPRKV